MAMHKQNVLFNKHKCALTLLHKSVTSKSDHSKALRTKQFKERAGEQSRWTEATSHSLDEESDVVRSLSASGSSIFLTTMNPGSRLRLPMTSLNVSGLHWMKNK